MNLARLPAVRDVMVTVICGRTGETSSPTQAAGVVTSQETNGSESTLLTRR